MIVPSKTLRRWLPRAAPSPTRSERASTPSPASKPVTMRWIRRTTNQPTTRIRPAARRFGRKPSS